MEKIIKQLENVAKNTRLSTVEKSEIKSMLLQYVKSHPVNTVAFSSRSVKSPFSINDFRNKKTLSAFVIGGLLLGSTVSFASESTVPGDVLYPVKIHINEPVLGAIAVTPQAKADWGVRKAERRLEEVEKLAEEPEVTPQVRELAEANFNVSTNQVQEHIANFENDDDSDDAIATAEKFAEMLRKHERKLGERDALRLTAAIERASIVPVAVNAIKETSVNTVQPATSAVKEKKESVGNVLKNVRGARGNAEKVQKELKQKYNREDIQSDQNPVAQTAPSFENKKIDRSDSNRVNIEEIRSIPVNTTPSAGTSEPHNQTEND